MRLNEYYQVEFEFVDTNMAGACDAAVELLRTIFAKLPSKFVESPRDSFDSFDIIDLSLSKPKVNYDNYDAWAFNLSRTAVSVTIVQHTPQTPPPRLNRSLATDPSLSLGFDFVLPEGYGELLSGGERDLDELAAFWDLETPLRNSSGFGIGLERLLNYATRAGSVKLVHPHHVGGSSQ